MSRDAEHLAGPPVAPVESSRRELHGEAWNDDYAWMRRHADPRLSAYLGAERRYYDRAIGHLQSLRNTLVNEVERRLLLTESSVSWKRGAFLYYTRTLTGSDYEQFVSRSDHGGPATVLLDERELCDGSGYVEVGVREVSPDGRLLAYSVDTTGDEVYALRFRELARAGQDPGRTLSEMDDLPDGAPRTYYGGAWSADSSTFFYTVHDDLYRPHQVWRHTIGDPDDVLVFTENDARFEVTVRASRSGRYVFVECGSRDTSETWLVPADDPAAAPRLVRPRAAGAQYRVDHCREHDDLLIVTNDDAVEFRLVRAPAEDPGRWSEVAPPRAGERLLACHVLRDALVLELRRDGFALLRVLDRDASGTVGDEREITAGIPAGTLAIATELEYAATAVTVKIESLVEPPAWYDVDLATGVRKLRKRQEVPGYDASAYRTERRHAIAPDGTCVPYTLAWRADTPLDGTAPALLWGYGAYESCDDPAFDPMLPSLLDRGVVYALTHPRGGGEEGRRWWLDGRLDRKANTFIDHLAVADWLAGDRPGTSATVDGSRIATRGLSAGGLLQGVVYNQAPHRWRVVVAEVPFVDVITSMLDPDIPLTVNEWDEWGDPRQPEAYRWMREYAPYENLPDGRRPALLVTGALHDPRVLVHEPAKWVARLRATAKPDDGPVLFRVELGAGAHTGPSGRYAHYRYEAEIYAFVLDHLLG